MKITIEGETHEERRRILGMIEGLLRADGRYTSTGVNYAMKVNASSQSYDVIDESKIYTDMSVSACMARYDAERESILDRIRDGKVSASMSLIEYYPWAAKDADIARDPLPIKTAMTWNGQVNIKRDNWRQEFEEWRKSR